MDKFEEKYASFKKLQIQHYSKLNIEKPMCRAFNDRVKITLTSNS